MPMSATMPAMAAILFYDYVPDIVEKRAPFRDAHLAALNALFAEGRLSMAGAYMDPTDGAAIVFSDVATAQAFPPTDPYVINGLVTHWHVRELNIAVGR
jgi:uncharacterized protein YciI